MPSPSVYLVEEALSLPPAERAEFARLLMDSLAIGGKPDDEITAELRSRLADLKLGKDAGLTFEEIFGEKA